HGLGASSSRMSPRVGLLLASLRLRALKLLDTPSELGHHQGCQEAQQAGNLERRGVNGGTPVNQLRHDPTQQEEQRNPTQRIDLYPQMATPPVAPPRPTPPNATLSGRGRCKTLGVARNQSGSRGQRPRTHSPALTPPAFSRALPPGQGANASDTPRSL